MRCAVCDTPGGSRLCVVRVTPLQQLYHIEHAYSTRAGASDKGFVPRGAFHIRIEIERRQINISIVKLGLSMHNIYVTTSRVVQHCMGQKDVQHLTRNNRRRHA